MATYDLEEQEQIAEIKAWWKQYGNLLVSIVTVVSIGVLAWQGWNWYQRGQTAKAAVVYGALQKAIVEDNAQGVRTASGELLAKFAGTAYAPLAALSAAKVMFDAGDTKTAKLQLQWVVDNGEQELRDLARLRLATVLLDEKAYDEALRQLEGATAAGFWQRAVAFFAAHGITTIVRVLTDNGSCYRSKTFNKALRASDTTHKYTRPYRPQTNGKVERYQRTLSREWARSQAWDSNEHRSGALQAFLDRYNYRRPHTALGGNPPISRCPGVTNVAA